MTRRLFLVLALLSGCSTAANSAALSTVIGNTIVIGQSGVYSGPLGAFAQDNINVINTYFESVNAQGGIYGRKLKLIALDDGFDPKRTLENAKTLIEKEQVFTLFNVIGTANTAAIYPLLVEHGIALLGPYTGATALRDFTRFRNLFFTRASYADETEKMVEHLTSTGVRNIAVVYQNDPFGKAGLQAANEALARRQLKPVATAAFSISKMEETGVAAATLAKHQPSAVIIASSGRGTTSFIKETLRQGQRPWFYCLSVTNPRQLWADLGKDAHGVVVSQVAPSPWRPAMPLIREYHQIINKLNYKDFSYGSLEGFIVARVAVEALKLAGPNLTRARYFAALESMRDFDLGGFSIRYRPGNHSGSSFVDLTIISKDGRFVR